jgi:hypothetical protein
MSPSTNVEKCLLCGRPTHSRGLCNTHYAWARRDVLEGRATWEGLEAGGRARPLGAGWRRGGGACAYRRRGRECTRRGES